MIVDTDLLNNAASADVARGTFRLLETLQNLPLDQQVQAVTAAFHVVCDVYEVNVTDELVRSARMFSEAEKRGLVEFRALRQYLTEEIRQRRSRS